MMAKKWTNKWICNPKFLNLEPLHLLHKQLEAFEPPHHEEHLKNNHTLFRKKVQITKPCQSACLDISADDYYKLYINGNFVTQGPASSYPFCYNYNCIDITEYLQQGENVIGVHVYYQGMINRAYSSGDYRQGMIAELFVDGSQIIDNVWKYKEAREYTTTGTIGYETQFIENIDNRLKIKDWAKVTYHDDDWQEAPIKENDDHILSLQVTPNVQTKKIEPKSVTPLPDGYLLDFGTVVTGQFCMRAVGKSGQEIRIYAGEELKTDTEVLFKMRCNCLYEETFTLDDGENFLNQYDYKCFRYVMLKMEDTISVDNFYVLYRHYPLDEAACSFNSSNVLLNEIWRICAKAVQNCSQEAYLDCPHREKGQYLSDLLVTAHAQMYLAGDTRLFKKALMDFAHSAVICKGLMAVAPGNYMQEFADSSLDFPYLLLTYYKFSGDIDFLKEMIPVLDGLEQYFNQYLGKNGLLENVKEKANLVDWPPNLRDGYDFELTIPNGLQDGCHNAINAMYCGMIKSIEKIKEILGVPYESRFDDVKKAFIDNFFCMDTGLFTDSTVSSHSALHSNIFALFYELLPDCETKIVPFIKEKGLSCGVHKAYHLLYGLAKVGEYGLIYDLITSEAENSWANMIREGATATFEAWSKEQKWNTSLCHAFAAAPIPAIVELLCGVQPLKAGFEEISINPHLPDEITKLNATFLANNRKIVLNYPE